MVELKAKTPCEGLLPVEIGNCRLEEHSPGPMVLITPLGKVSLKLPAPGQMIDGGDHRLLWFGRNEYLMMGATPPEGMNDQAALVDQSDGWAVVMLSGAGAEDVLARLVPIDLRATAFPEGSATRTQLQHQNIAIARGGADQFMILAFRSMAHSLVHDLKTAMEHVAARG